MYWGFPLDEKSFLGSNTSLAVTKPEIPAVVRIDTWAELPVTEVIGSDYAAVIQLRMTVRAAIARGEPIYACPRCSVPVYLVSREDTRRFYFKHLHEDGNCPAVTRGGLSEKEINAQKYNAAKESPDHLRMKELIEESIKCDSRFAAPLVEKTWKGADGSWRRPDVQAQFGQQRIAFEVQLSTTFIRVIAERREFYLREGGMLVWLFKHFTEHDTRLTQDDVFYNNNRNAFLASEETLAASRATGRLHLECCWSAPTRQNNEIVLTQHRKIVSIDELTLDVERQRIFYFDFDQEMAKASVTSQQASAERLRRDFEAFWLSKPASNTQETLSQWYAFRRRFSEHGIQLSQYLGGDGTESLLNNLYSAKHGKVVGRSFKKFIEVAHRVAGGYKEHLWAFGLLLAAHNRVEQIWAEDKNSGKWEKKRSIYHPRIKAGDDAYRPDPRFNQLIGFLFPEIADGLGRYPVRTA